MATAFCTDLFFNHSKKSNQSHNQSTDEEPKKEVVSSRNKRSSAILFNWPRVRSDSWVALRLPSLCSRLPAAVAEGPAVLQGAAAVQSTRWCHPVSLLQSLSSHSSAAGCPGHCRRHPVLCDVRKRYVLQLLRGSRRTKWAVKQYVIYFKFDPLIPL